MTTGATTKDTGYGRYTFRVRLSATARRAIWNECVAKSKQVHAQ
ncbi:transposase, partial [Streptomyces chiangmaiensis]|nr:transposase [Streptomyces chiangmaiensis]